MSLSFHEADIAIIGGGFGGVAAALAAAEAGQHVILTEATDWIGGQVTSQAVAPLDEHQYIESFGGTRTYYRFREGVRAYYRDHYPAARDAAQPLNPGDGWVSALCFEPRVGLAVLEEMLAPHIAAGRVRLLLNHTPLRADVRSGHIHEVTLNGPQAEQVGLRANLYLDATELGDLLPLVGAPYDTGAEAVEDTGEPHAAVDGPHPERVQSFTHCCVVEYCPGENHTIRKPYGYEYYRENQFFSLILPTRSGLRRFMMFAGDLPFWEYRRLFSASQLVPGIFADAKTEHSAQPRSDIAVINWDANDFYKESLIDRTPAQQARILREAKRLTLSFLYWLQTEAPHDDNRGRGYPGLKLLPQAVGTADGLAKAPYIREARRVIGYRRVLEQDVIAAQGRGARAVHYSDAIGIGWYPIDLHRCAGDPPRGQETRAAFDPSLPFQIPLGALLSPAVDNLIAAAKNISTTHLTNGAYRLHPVEWAIGEAAGALAAVCVADGRKPRAVWESPDRLRAFQQTLLARGMPLAWTIDLGREDADFRAIQTCLLDAAYQQGALLPGGSPRRERHEILPDAILSRAEAAWLIERLPPSKANAQLAPHLGLWKDTPRVPLTAQDWSLACSALDLSPGESSPYPTLRQVCRKLQPI